MNVFVETDRLILREILPEDDNRLFELDSDPDVHKFLGNQPINSIEQAREVIRFIREQYVENGIGRWAIIEKNANTFIGWTGLKFKVNKSRKFREPTSAGHNLRHDVR